MTPAKPIVTTAPSSQVQQGSLQLSQTQTIPPLKQKTGIIKSKVPPPVPPRGSPRVDRRTSASSNKSAGISPRGTPPSTGSQNYLNDKYFDVIQPNPNNMCRLTPQKLYQKSNRSKFTEPRSPTPQPIFGERRSPTCVRDWLEVNDFAASNYDESAVDLKVTEPIKNVTIKPRRPLPIKTGHLQLRSSFRYSYSSGSSVRSMIKNYSAMHESRTAPNVIITSANDEILSKSNSTSDQIEILSKTNSVSDRIKAYNKQIKNVDNSYKNSFLHRPKDINANAEKPKPAQRNTIRTQNAVNGPKAAVRLKKSNGNDSSAQVKKSDSILSTLKRKDKVNQDLDENCNAVVSKRDILKSLSNINTIEDSKYLDAFSLDGEFV